HFYSIEQGLSALVDLPDGRVILVDTAASSIAPGCGAAACANAHQHLIDKLTHDLAGRAIDMMWITHQHEDHIGGAADLLAKFKLHNFVDNGRAITVSEVADANNAAQSAGVAHTVVSPAPTVIPFKSTKALRIQPLVPPV